jgi:uncharacterized protein
MSDIQAILSEVLGGYALSVHGIHGAAHWARVWENGLRMAPDTGADVEIVTLFALLHDARRLNDGRDHDHGLRGGELARTLRGNLIHLEDARFELLYVACRDHTRGYTDADPTIQTCWDADRLDLLRVGIMPIPDRLCTDAARALLPWANKRADACFEPELLVEEWGPTLRAYSGDAATRSSIVP